MVEEVGVGVVRWALLLRRTRGRVASSSSFCILVSKTWKTHFYFCNNPATIDGGQSIHLYFCRA